MEEERKDVQLGLRKFIKDLGYITGGTMLLAMTPWLSSCTPDKLEEVSKERKARIALIGCGSRGQYHLVNLKNIAHASLVALCDIYQTNLDKAKEMFPEATTYTNYRKLLENKDIDGVIIAVPLGLHAQITLDALAAGKHVFCEKAMALTLEDCKRVYEAYNAQDKALYFCMQRMYDEKYIRGFQMIKSGLIGDVVGMRPHWFRNADWRRPVPSPELERLINWRLYRESSGGLMTELGSHQLEVCTLITGKMPVEVSGFGDIVYWKDGREVNDSCSVVYRFSDGRLINYQTLISNKYNGMEDQVLGQKGTANLAKGVYYLEEDNQVPGMRQLLDEIKTNVFSSIPTAGPSWKSETAGEYIPHSFLGNNNYSVNRGESMIGAENDGSLDILSAFCQSCITGEKATNVVEEAYCATTLCLLANQAMDEHRVVTYPDEYKIPYMHF